MRKVIYISAFVLLACCAISFRSYDIAADLPAYFAGGGQDFTTDAAYLTLYAKSAVQFGTWDLFGFEPWTNFKVTIISGVSYLIFLLGGVSRTTAALTGTVLQLFGLAFFLAGSLRWLRRETVLGIAAMLSFNYLLVLFGRVPFTEDGVIFFAGVAFWVYSYWFDRDWGKVAVGALIAAAALFGKSLGFLIGGGPLLFLLVTGEERRVKNFILLGAPVVVMTLLYAFAVRSEGGFFAFLWEYGVGEHGAPHGFSSPLGFLESLVSVSRTGLHQYSPVLSIVAYLAVVASLLGVVNLGERRRVFYFMLGWFLTWLVLISPFNYQPVRYIFILTIPMAFMVGTVTESLPGYVFPRKSSWWRFAVLFFLNWYAIYSGYVAIFVDSLKTETMIAAVWKSFPFAIGLTILLLLLAFTAKRHARIRSSAIILVVVAIGTIATDMYQFYLWFPHRTHMVEEAANDIKTLVNPGAVIGGQCGPALAANANLGALRLFLRKDLPAFEQQVTQFPVTHIATGKANFDESLQASPMLQRSPVLATFWLRDNYVRVARINGATGNATASRYQLTDYERAIDLMYAGKYAAAQEMLATFLAQHPYNKTALTEQYYLDIMVKQPRDAQPIVDTLYKYYRTDYAVSLLAAIFYKFVAAQTGGELARKQAETCFRDAIWYGPRVAKETEQMYRLYTPADRIVR